MTDYQGTINVNGNPPKIIKKPFAYGGVKGTFQIGATGSNRASLEEGFPPITSRPIGSGENEGGVPPSRVDFNTLGYDTTSWLYYLQNGGVVKYDSQVADAIGGYPQYARLWVQTDSGTYIVRAKSNNSVDPASEIENIKKNLSNNWQLEFSSQIDSTPYPDWSNANDLSWDNDGKCVFTADGWVNIIFRGTIYYWLFIGDVPVCNAYARGTDYGSVSTTFIPVKRGDVLSLKIGNGDKFNPDITQSQINTGIRYARFSKFIPIRND